MSIHEWKTTAFKCLCLRGCIQKFPDWLPGATTANGKTLCHYMQLCRYFVSQSSAFFRHNPFCCFSTSVYFRKRIFRYRLTPETFGYILVWKKRYGQDASRYQARCWYFGTFR